MASALTNGKICYLELPALDVDQSASFYARVFGWSMRTRGDGSHAFDDTTGAVSGAFVFGRQTWSAPALVFYRAERSFSRLEPTRRSSRHAFVIMPVTSSACTSIRRGSDS